MEIGVVINGVNPISTNEAKAAGACLIDDKPSNAIKAV